MDAYRCGRFEEALAHLPEKGDAWCEPLSYFFQAMARYRLGDTEQARELLGRGIEAMEQKVPTIDGPPLGDWLPDRWIVWCIVDVVRREAEETIGAKTGDQRSQAPANVKPENEH